MSNKSVIEAKVIGQLVHAEEQRQAEQARQKQRQIDDAKAKQFEILSREEQLAEQRLKKLIAIHEERDQLAGVMIEVIETFYDLNSKIAAKVQEISSPLVPLWRLTGKSHPKQLERWGVLRRHAGLMPEHRDMLIDRPTSGGAHVGKTAVQLIVDGNLTEAGIEVQGRRIHYD